jgi:hypothetical protein
LRLFLIPFFFLNIYLFPFNKMPLFDLKNAKKRLTSPSLPSLGLRKTQSTGDIDDSVLSDGKCHLIVTTPKDTKSILKTSSNDYFSRKPPTPPPQHLPSVPEDEDDDILASKLKDITACDMELLLSMETQARMDAQEERDHKNSFVPPPPSRTSTIKFELPVTPPRSKSPDTKRQHRWSLPDESLLRSETAPEKPKKKKSNRLSRWSRIILIGQESDASCSDDSASDEQVESSAVMAVGIKVKLIKRPLPTMGTIKYIGPVTMYGVTGEWIGVELESRGKMMCVSFEKSWTQLFFSYLVGNTNGSVEGYQYFLTDPQRGIFVKREDLVIA